MIRIIFVEPKIGPRKPMYIYEQFSIGTPIFTVTFFSPPLIIYVYHLLLQYPWDESFT